MLKQLSSTFRSRTFQRNHLRPASELPVHHAPVLRSKMTSQKFRRCTRRTLLKSLLVLSVLLVYIALNPWIWGTELVARLFGPDRLPPLYPEFRAAEWELPQHHVRDPFANGQKYLWISSHPTSKDSPRLLFCSLFICFQGQDGGTSCRTWWSTLT